MARPTADRRGFTLMELLLVMAIMVIAAAAVMPSFRGAMRNSQLRSAADTVRSELIKAHVAAMRTGRVQVFRYEQNGGKYKTEPFLSGDEALEGPPPDAAAPAPTQHGHQPLHEPALPDGTRFVMADAAVQARGQQIESELASGSGANWGRPILFYPDGATVDAFLIVGNDQGHGIRIDLRGLTAAVKVSDIHDAKQLEEMRSAWQQQ
jgi:type II secretion system protein H